MELLVRGAEQVNKGACVVKKEILRYPGSQRLFKLKLVFG